MINFKKILLLFCTIFLVFNCMKNDNELVFNLGSSYNTLDPHLFTEMIAVQVDSSIYEGLLVQDKDGDYLGGVAESFQENKNKLTFKIRDNAKWSDGSPVTAYDFVFGFKRVLNPKVGAQYADMLFPIKNAEKYYEGKVGSEELGIKALDEKNLEITLEHPTAYFKFILTLPIAMPLKEDFYKSREDKFAVEKEDFLFNGPYVIKELKEDEIILEKNKYYWNEKNINIPKIKYVISSDFRVVEELIKNNEIHMSRVENYNLKKHKESGNIDTFSNGRVWYLEFNLDNKILANKKVRKAISSIINRTKYVEKIKNDGSIEAKSVIGRDTPGYKGKYRIKYPDSNYIEENADKGKKIYEEGLAEIGIDKKDVRFILVSGNSDPEVLEVQFIQEELKQILGINTEVVTLPFKERITRARSGEYDIMLNTWSPKYDDALSYLDRWKNKGKNNQWSKKEYNNLLNEIKYLESSEERDKKVNMAEKIIIDEAIIAPIYFSVENHYRKKNIKNVVRKPVTGMTDFRWATYK